MLSEHPVPRRMDGGKKMENEEEKMRTEDNSRQTTLEEFGLEFN